MELLRMGLLAELGTYVSGFSFESLSLREIDKVRTCTLDWLAVALAGSDEEACRLTRSYILSVDGGLPVGGGPPGAHGQGGALLLGVEGGARAAPPFAALANGTAGHALDYDDVTTFGSGHPSAPVIPAVLAVGEQLGSSGKDVLTAIAVGMTVELAVGLPIMPGHYRQGFHNTATLGRLGAAAGASRLARLAPDRCQSALSAAVATASGLRSSFGTMLKSVQVGWAAMGGVVAAGLAREGVTGPQESLDGELSLFGAMAPSVNREVVEALRRGLRGEMSPGELGGAACVGSSLSECAITSVRLKAYPSCLSTHGAIMAALEVRSRLPGRDPSAIDGIECTVHPLCLEIAADPAPDTGLAAKFSVQYCLAMALTDGAVRLGSFSDGSVRRPEVGELAGKVRLVGKDGYAERRECELVVRLRDGDALTARSRVLTPLDPDEEARLANAKLEEACRLYFGNRGRGGEAAGRAARIAETVRNLENLEDIRTLTSLISDPL